MMNSLQWEWYLGLTPVLELGGSLGLHFGI